jgi:dihydroorotate dehydrogenase electron transfer subunit
VEEGLRNYASLESNMACGVGACMGCVVSILDKEHGTGIYKKVCEDGPVFDAETVIW